MENVLPSGRKSNELMNEYSEVSMKTLRVFHVDQAWLTICSFYGYNPVVYSPTDSDWARGTVATR